MKKLTVGSCFAGIGGLELGLEWTGGFETKWQIENDEYASRVLAKHWPGVKHYSDIRNVVRPDPVDLICGGFPCQDVSLAGKREGLGGKRSTLWGEMFRLICKAKPRWVVAENVPGLLSSDGGRFFGNILGDLASSGYDAEWGVLSAAGVGAPHIRERIFIIAHTQCLGREARAGRTGIQSKEQNAVGSNALDVREVLADAPQLGGIGRMARPREAESGRAYAEATGHGWWIAEPNVGRVASRVPFRVDRLRCLGNAVVPQVAQKIGEMILMAERNDLSAS